MMMICVMVWWGWSVKVGGGWCEKVGVRETRRDRLGEWM